MKTKLCPRCKVEKLRTDFYKSKSTKDGLAVCCIECAKIDYKLNREKRRETEKNYYQNNKERIKQVRKEYREKNIEKIRERERKKSKITSKIYYQKNKEIINEKYKESSRVYSKEYRKKNKEKIREKTRYSKKYKRKTNHLFRLKENIRGLILSSIKKNKYTKKSKTYQILGCSYEEFKLYLESKFQPWMNWYNYGNPKDGIIELNKSWDIDHIIPVSSAKTEEEVIKLNHYSNLQPLCSYNNRYIKRNKIINHGN